MTITKCSCCGKSIAAERKTKKWCSDRCRIRNLRQPKKLIDLTKEDIQELKNKFPERFK
jgi:predicted nucleic acid-binding Zn ribbon protein